MTVHQEPQDLAVLEMSSKLSTISYSNQLPSNWSEGRSDLVV
jgi:hypothetical protein